MGRVEIRSAPAGGGSNIRILYLDSKAAKTRPVDR